MRKILAGALVILAILLIAVYIFIPAETKVLAVKTLNRPASATVRFLSAEQAWRQWWPNKTATGAEQLFTYQNTQFSLLRAEATIVNIPIQYTNQQLSSTLAILPAADTQTLLTWQSTLAPSANPLTRIKNYLLGRRIKATMSDVLSHLQSFMQSEENVYGFTVAEKKVVDTLLVTKSQEFNHEPSTVEVYAVIQELQSYVTANASRQTNPPMLHVERNDSTYFTQLALPINKAVPETKSIRIKRMVPGKILVAEVKGGPQTVRNAFMQLENYLNDYRKVSPAIPFFSLVTDRSAQTDTTSWITRLYYPIL